MKFFQLMSITLTQLCFIIYNSRNEKFEGVIDLVCLHEETAKHVITYKGIAIMTKEQAKIINFSCLLTVSTFTTPDISLDLKFHFFSYHI